MIPLILASSSPYRRALLERLGLDFQHLSPNIDEQAIPAEQPRAMAERLAQAKARTAAIQYASAGNGAGLFIGSDQVASLQDTILGKPGSHERAREQLSRSSGQTVHFYTGLCLYNSASGRMQTQVETYSAHFRRLSRAQIEAYLQADQPYDCAGSCKCEQRGIALFESLEGRDPNTLIGLPLIALTTMLINEGLDPLLAPPR